jgi:hypothetical protein
MMQSRDFKNAKAEMILNDKLDLIKEPENYIDIDIKDIVDELTNNNIKGDGTKKIKTKSKKTTISEKTEEEKCIEDKKKQHLYFLLKYPDRFNTYRFKNNILVNEFKNMSEARKLAYTEAFGIDMETMSQLVNMLYENNVIII